MKNSALICFYQIIPCPSELYMKFGRNVKDFCVSLAALITGVVLDWRLECTRFCDEKQLGSWAGRPAPSASQLLLSNPQTPIMNLVDEFTSYRYFHMIHRTFFYQPFVFQAHLGKKF